MVGLEPTGHYWFSLAAYLQGNGIKLVLVNPYHVKRSKELDDGHPGKSGKKDPKTIAKLVAMCSRISHKGCMRNCELP